MVCFMFSGFRLQTNFNCHSNDFTEKIFHKTKRNFGGFEVEEASHQGSTSRQLDSSFPGSVYWSTKLSSYGQRMNVKIYLQWSHAHEHATAI